MPNEFEPPKSRIEAILQNMLGAENVLQPPQSRVEYYLMKILEEGLGSEVVANPTLEGTEDPLTGLEVDGIKFKVPEVEANPTLIGDETNLTSVEINGTKYSVYDIMTVDFSGSSLSEDIYTKALAHARKGLPFKSATGSQIYVPYRAVISYNDGFSLYSVSSSGSGNPYPNIQTIIVDAAGIIARNEFEGRLSFANPTLAGTEADLNGLQVGSTKYKVPKTTIDGVGGAITLGQGLSMTGSELSASGGSEQHLYWHPIRLTTSGGTTYTNVYAYISIYSTRATKYEFSDLRSLLASQSNVIEYSASGIAKRTSDNAFLVGYSVQGDNYNGLRLALDPSTSVKLTGLFDYNVIQIF